MLKEIEKQINDSSLGKVVKLKGKMNLDFTMDNSFTVGHLPFKSIIGIKRSGVIIDGSEAEIVINIKETFKGDWSLFYLYPNASNVELRNLTIKVIINNSIHCTRMFAVIYNTAFGLKINNCHIELYSNKQINLYGVYSNGNLDTHLDTRTDNLIIDNSFIKISCLSNEHPRCCSVYGIYNYLSNSTSIQNNYIFAINNGNSANQKAIGIYTNGRFGRFIGNNIKSNADYPEGFEQAHASAIGFINEGSYSIISNNNIIAEWAGCAIGLDNKGEYCIINANKVLSTHTICGKSIKNTGNKVNITGNIITSTSRNARLIEHNASGSIISHNIMETLMPEQECRSGCGIYAIGGNMSNNNITENIVYNVLNCGLFVDRNVGIFSNNQVVSFLSTQNKASSDDIYLLERLSEKNIRSIKCKTEG